jgi:hypothetical protein
MLMCRCWWSIFVPFPTAQPPAHSGLHETLVPPAMYQSLARAAAVCWLGSRRHTVLYSADTVLYYTILYYTVLYYPILYYTILSYTILYYTILYRTILYYTILYYTLLYYIIPYPTILY